MERTVASSPTLTITATIGVLFGLAGIDHGVFETLQGNVATRGLVIQAIGEAHRFWPLGTEEAFTIIPNYLISGICSIVVGAAIAIWSILFLRTRHGRTIFLGLFVVLFLVGGGIGQVAFFIPAWAFSTRAGRPHVWWRNRLPERLRRLLSKSWTVVLAVSVLSMIIGLEIAIFGYIPGISDPELIRDTSMALVFASAILNIVAYISGFASEIDGKTQDIQEAVVHV